MKKALKKALKRQSFTLIEVVIVIVILVTLASIATPMYFKYISDANIGAAKTQIKNLANAVDGYYAKHKVYPQGEDLKALVEDPGDLEKAWDGPFINGSLPKDPWGRDYIYKCPGDENRPYEIISYGADGVEGGEGENADIKNWE